MRLPGIFASKYLLQEVDKSVINSQPITQGGSRPNPEVSVMETDRRSHERMNLARPCKVFDPKSGKYVLGTVWNLSDGGALVETTRPVVAQPGEPLFLGIALKRRQGLILGDQMLQINVVRSLRTTDGRTTIAMKFGDCSIDVMASMLDRAA